jgi:thiamine-monophosphate kinase
LEWTPGRLLGRKALAISISDIAAMGGVPRQAVVSLCLRPETTLGFVDALYDGLLERAAEAGVSIVGGNLASTAGPLVVDVTLLGQGDRLLRRKGALAGDRIVATGWLGAAATGLRLLAEGARLDSDGTLMATGLWTETSRMPIEHCLRAQLDPAPPWILGRALAEQQLAHAVIDLSDGLSGDLLTLCEESEVAALIDPAGLPIDRHAASLTRARGGDAVGLALHGGEDYQLLMAVAPEALGGIQELASMWEIPLADVGEFVAGQPGIALRGSDGVRPLKARAHEHFVPRLGMGMTPQP